MSVREKTDNTHIARIVSSPYLSFLCRFIYAKIPITSITPVAITAFTGSTAEKVLLSTAPSTAACAKVHLTESLHTPSMHAPPNMHFQYHFILSLLIVIQHNFTIFVNIIPSRSIYFKYYLVFHTFSTPSSSYTFSYTRILSHRQVPIRLESPTKSLSRRISALICKQGVPLFPEK